MIFLQRISLICFGNWGSFQISEGFEGRFEMTREVGIAGWGAVCVLCPEGRCDGCSREGAGRL